MKKFNELSDQQARQKAMDAYGPDNPSSYAGARRPAERGRTAVWQARLVLLVMINIAQLWILAATVDAALARHYSVLLPLVIASGVCFLITVSILRWWRPVSRRKTSTGYIRNHQ